MRILRWSALLCGVLLYHSASASPEARAVRLVTAPQLDGQVTDDPAWQQLQPIESFVQQQPQEGLPATLQTQVFVGFDDSYLYVAFVCHDDDPDGIIFSNKRRDANLSNTDSFRMVIDAFKGRQTGLVFGTNPTGLEYDGQVSNEGGSRFGSGGIDLNWDTTWSVATHTGDFGWSGEFRIPFTSLRYASGDIQSWGFNFQRTVRRINEVSYWSPLPRQYGLNRLSLAGSIVGIEVPPQRNFSVTPYVVTRRSEGGNLSDETDTDAGFDAKFSVTPSLTLDMTYNTDFAQVEVDQQQVNLNRFSLFFPEKRPFFLENASQFQVGAPGLQLFFSRNIGIAGGGEPIPIVGGLRLSGKVGAATNVGVLAMRSKSVTGVAEETDFAVLRLRQELGGRSSIGMLAIDRDDGRSDNQTYAVDGRWGIGESGTLAGFIARTSTPGIDDDDHAINLFAGYESEKWAYNIALTEVGAGFNPEVGFLSRRNYRAINLFGLRSIRPAKESRVLEYRPHASYTGFWDFDGFYETGRWHIDSSIEWKSGAQLHTAINHNHEGVKNAFEISSGVTIPAKDYDDWEFSMFSSTNQSAPIRVGLGLQVGGFFGGDRVGASPFIGYRPNDAFETSLSWNYNDIELPGGDFDVGLTNFRMSYAFSPKMSLTALVQYNDRDELTSTNLRFSWLQSANTGLYVVYNETDDDINSPGRPRKEFILKYNRIFNLR